MDLDDIGYFGLPIKGTVTPSVQSSLSSSSSSSRLRKKFSKHKNKIAGVAAAPTVAVAARGPPQHEHAPLPASSTSSSLVPNRKKRNLPSSDSDTRHERKQQSIHSFFRTNNVSSQNNYPDSTTAPQNDFVTASSIIDCENGTKGAERNTRMQTQDMKSSSSANRSTLLNTDDMLENYSDDELVEREGEGQDTMINSEREGIYDNIHQKSRERRRLNHVEFGIHHCIIGHRLLPTARLTHHGGHQRRIDSLKSSAPLTQRHLHEQRLLHGTCGVNILSNLVQRSCIPTSTTSSSITKDMRKFVNSGNHWNICNTVELAADSDYDYGGYPSHAVVPQSNGDICTMTFDRDGVLLATGDDRGIVRIYDFDDVCALDMKKRNEISRISLRQDYSIVGTDEIEIDDNGENDRVISSEIMAATDHSEADEESTTAVRSIPPSVARPVLSFQCNGSRASSNNTGHRISSVQWSPYNQDHLAISFANLQEIHIYDTASDESPIPCLRLLDSRCFSRSEGVSKALFIPPSTSSTSMQIITGGSYGTVNLWTIPQTRSRRRIEPISNLSAQCSWSMPAFASKGEGVSDILVLPTGGASKSGSSNSLTKPLVLIAGNGTSLTLLDTNKCTRKAFATTVTPSVVSSWDLYQFTVRELSIIDPEAKPPARKWIAAQKLTVLQHECIDCSTRIQISIVVKCGWILLADMSLPNQSISSSSVKFQVHIVHRTPRIQCFNSSNERLATIGGMALQFSLPDIPIISTNLNGMILLGDVKQMQYTLPSKDKYVVGEEHGNLTTRTNQLRSDMTLSSGMILRHPGDGLVLAQLGTRVENRRTPQLPDSCICARLPTRGLPSSLAAHPSGEWIVIGYGKGATDMVTMRRLP